MLLSSHVACALTLLNVVQGHPAKSPVRPRTVDLSTLRMKSSGSYISVSSGQKRSLEKGKRVTNLETATSFLQRTFPNITSTLSKDSYIGTNGIEHFYFKQTINNVITIDNADINVNVADDGGILSYGHSLFTGPSPDSAAVRKREFVDPLAALAKVVSALNLSISIDAAIAKLAGSSVVFDDTHSVAAVSSDDTYIFEGTIGSHQAPKARLVYLKSEKGLDLAWRVETDMRDNWMLTYVDATRGETVLGVVDYAAHARYLVYPWGQESANEGPRIIESDPYDKIASPLSWHSGSAASSDTRGNNIITQSNLNGNLIITDDYRPTVTNGDFIYNFNSNASRSSEYINASVTQLFYTTNMMHDLLYNLGFNEMAGNFQEINRGKGGVDGDAVIVNSQDGQGYNNAFFLTPSDGNRPRMTMQLWGNPKSQQPLRDSSFDSDIVIHEYTHGLSNRLTGGPANSKCLQTTEAQGLGEGWSDFFSIAINLSPATNRNTPRPVGAWVKNNYQGVRAVPYTTNFAANELLYSSVNGVEEIHSLGTVWSTILYEVFWDLVDVYGVNYARKPNYITTTMGQSIPSDGRYLAMKFVMDGMALQPCNPTIVHARDSVLDADRVLTGGGNLCMMWKAFARRGLGFGANETSVMTGIRGEPILRVDAFDIPKACR